jgi:recombination associated protein RdgC
MWFRNLTLFRLLKPFETSPEELEEALALKPFRPCGSLEMETRGWVAPVGKAEAPLCHVAGAYRMLCARNQQRLLPASVIREVVNDKVEEIEEEEGRKVGRKERQSIRDEVIQDLLPKAFTRSRDTYAYLDTNGDAGGGGWLLVDSAARNRAEDLSVLLRECLGTLPIGIPKTQRNPAEAMTEWLRSGAAPAGFAITDECELREPAEGGGVVRCTRLDLASDEVRTHLDAGRQVAKLGLAWRDRATLVLGDDLQVRKLRFQDVVLEAAADAAGESKEQAFDADFAILSQELSAFLPDLLDAFGGEVRGDAGAAF